MVFELTILGSSSALPTSERYPSAHVLNAHERIFLIDCGEGTQMQLRKFRIKMSKIHNIFISHLHGDHIFGLYGLLSTFNLTGRKSDLRLFAPAEYQNILYSHLADFDIHLNFKIEFVPLNGTEPRQVFENKDITVHSLPLQHRIPSYGFLFREKKRERNIIREAIGKYKLSLADINRIKKGDDYFTEDGKIVPNGKLTTDPPEPRSFAYCSDTSYFERLSGYIKGVDILYHEATFHSDMQELAVKTGHSTSAGAATIARNAGVGKLIIGHFSARYRDAEILLREAREIFPETYVAREGATFTAGRVS